MAESESLRRRPACRDESHAASYDCGVPRATPKSAPSERLAAAVQRGAVTLVLGAGVSLELGVPNWRGLVLRVWKSVKLKKAERARIEELARESQSLPLLFELAEQRLGFEAFVEAVRTAIYAEAAPVLYDDAGTTMGTIANAITADYDLAGGRRITRIVTFNADELLREALRRRRGERGQFWRTADHAVYAEPAGRGVQPVPIYHVHGFLPRGGAFGGLSEHRLVFTDNQYWNSGTSQASLANRTMNAALADSHCIFIGLSMTDSNLLRWLGLRYNQIADDTHAQASRVQQADPASTLAGAYDAKNLQTRIASRLGGHFWIRPPGDDPTGLLSEFLGGRGVEAVEISAWSDGSFDALFRQCFAP